MIPSRFAAGAYVFAGLSALVSVALAALTSHGLAGLAPTGDQAVVWFKIATEFQMNHALGVVLVAAIADQIVPGRARALMQTAAVLLGPGALLFPVALYSLSFLGPSFFAPYGGFAAMGGWALFAVSAAMAYIARARAA